MTETPELDGALPKCQHTQLVQRADRARWLHELSTTNGYSATYYAGAHFEREDKGIGQVNRYNLMAGGETIGYHTWKAGTTSTNYLHRDYQGSVRDVSGPAGAGGREETAYDAWGKRRNPVTYASYNAGSYLLTTALETVEGMRRGYTGHEHLDQLGLINMNGRIYDPEIARFLSADPFVQFPESTQGYNRYAYVNNNPMSYSDPSGYEIFSLMAAAWIANVQTVATVYWYEQMAIMAVAGYMDSGSLKGAATSAASAGLSNAIGGLGESGFFGSGAWEIARRSVAHGIVQGGLADAGGGRFGDGFLGGMSGGLSEYLDIPDGALGTVVVATIGGTVSTIGGGKFGNGAVSAAFVQAFNCMAHNCGPATDNEVLREAWGARNPEEAANTITTGVEVGAAVLSVPAASVGAVAGAEALALRTTVHGAGRVGATATRAGSLGRMDKIATRFFGEKTIQADGARVYYRLTEGGRYKFAIFDKQGLVTSGNWSSQSVIRMARRYGWENFP